MDSIYEDSLVATNAVYEANKKHAAMKAAVEATMGTRATLAATDDGHGAPQDLRAQMEHYSNLRQKVLDEGDWTEYTHMTFLLQDLHKRAGG